MDIIEILNNKKGITAITGAAGSGKTTMASLIQQKLSDCVKYSADFAFIGDSKYRKNLLDRKQFYSIEYLIDACNQFNWWDWEKIEKVLNEFKLNNTIGFGEVYDRDTGEFKTIKSSDTKDLLIYEGSILGPDSIINKIDRIFFLQCDPQIRLQRLLIKDSKRRSPQEIAARFLITEYSEAVFYKHLFKNYKDKITAINGDGNIIPIFNEKFEDDFYLPIRLREEVPT